MNYYEQFIANLDFMDVISMAKTYFGIEFSQEELEKVLPYLKTNYQHYFDPLKRDEVISNVKRLTTPQTFDKLNLLLSLAQQKFGKGL